MSSRLPCSVGRKLALVGADKRCGRLVSNWMGDASSISALTFIFTVDVWLSCDGDQFVAEFLAVAQSWLAAGCEKELPWVVEVELRLTPRPSDSSDSAGCALLVDDVISGGGGGGAAEQGVESSQVGAGEDLLADRFGHGHPSCVE